MDFVSSTVGVIFGLLLIFTIFSVVIGIQAGLLMFAWNLIAPLFHGPEMNFLQGVGAVFILALVAGYMKGSKKE